MRTLPYLLLLVLAVGCGGDDPKKKTPVENMDLTDQNDDGSNGDHEEEPVAPKAPTGLTATPTVQGAALSWNAADTATKYILLRSTTSGSGYTQVYTGTARSYVDGGLTAGSTYYYVVQAENEAGKSPDSKQAQATALYPLAAAPATVAVVKADAQLRIYWSAAAGAASYTLLRQTEGGGYTAVAAGPTLTNYVDSGVANGYRYGYKVQVANADGALTASTTATASPYHPGRQFCVPSQDGIHIFSAEADGAAAPVRTIAAARMFTNPTDMAVDPVRNRLYVLDTLAGNIAVYDTNFLAHPITSPPVATLAVPGAMAVTVATGAGELYVAGSTTLKVYDITVSPPTLLRSTTDLIRLAAVTDMALGGGEVLVLSGRDVHRYDASTLALIGTIVPNPLLYLTVVPLAIEYIGFNDRVAVLDTGGRIRVYDRNTVGQQETVQLRSSTYSDVGDIAYDGASRQLLFLRRDQATLANLYGIDVTSLTNQRAYKVFETDTPFSLIELDATNGRFYVMAGNRRVLLYTNLHTISGTSGGDSANNFVVSSLNGMSNAANIAVDATNEELLVRNDRGFLAIYSLLDGASNTLKRYSWLTGYGFTGDIAAHPAINRFYGEEPYDITWFNLDNMPTVVTSSSIVFKSYSGYYNNFSLSLADNRLYAFDAKPDTFSELHIRGLDADGDIRDLIIYDLAPTTSTGTNVAYGAFPGGGEVVAIDPGNKFGWVFTPSLALKRTFSLAGATSTWASLVADPVNQEVYVLRDGVVDAYNRNDLKGANVQPVRSATLLATGNVAAAKDIELCK